VTKVINNVETYYEKQSHLYTIRTLCNLSLHCLPIGFQAL